VKYIFFK